MSPLGEMERERYRHHRQDAPGDGYQTAQISVAFRDGCGGGGV